MNSSVMLIVVGLVLGLIQVAAAIPWLALLFWQDVKGLFGGPKTLPATWGQKPVTWASVARGGLVG